MDRPVSLSRVRVSPALAPLAPLAPALASGLACSFKASPREEPAGAVAAPFRGVAREVEGGGAGSGEGRAWARRGGRPGAPVPLPPPASGYPASHARRIP